MQQRLKGNMADNVLIIESKPALRSKLASALAEDAFEVVSVPDYFDALAELRKFQPDLAIVGADLPLLDGWKACYHLRQTFGIPVILMSSNNDTGARVTALRAEADFYMRMPFSYRELIARIKAILRRYRAAEMNTRA